MKGLEASRLENEAEQQEVAGRLNGYYEYHGWLLERQRRNA